MLFPIESIIETIKFDDTYPFEWYIRGMEILQFAYGLNQKTIALEAIEALREAGYEVIDSGGQDIDPNRIVLLLLSEGVSEQGLLGIGWFKEQFDYSSYPHLRMMPFVAYHSSKDDFDALWEKDIGDVYENLISGEFKPYGWDLDDPSSKIEFARILEDYEE